MIRKLALLAGAGFLVKKLLNKGQANAPSSPGHRPTDLMGNRHPDGSRRADEHYRPDPTGPVAAEDREGLRPVTMPAPHDPPGR
ncbi:hypothetical protein [Sphingobium vermicomposti]|uniref:Uncharacterized protein n=1 Tax=Sphingobium vermicomposti TaxID=529005 RepID=A0A846M754_9SPHN|nr:hypothetical protein [Sphingobium vermicomposti]NIJ18127.1 hypothetical protein [Sphingobium vermicomposti]